MASSGNNENSWWNSWVQNAKEKSLNAIELIRNDLCEFTSVMKNDITEVSSQFQIDSTLIDRVKTLSPSSSSKQYNTNNDKPNVKLDANKLKHSSTVYDRFKNELLHLQNSPDTYLHDPASSNLKHYLEWKESFDPDSSKGLISDLLIENSVMRSLYSQLVPAVISNKDFWSRYLFKAKLLEDEHKKRINLIEKATSQVNENTYENLTWDEEGNEDWNSCAKNDEMSEKKCMDKLYDNVEVGVKDVVDDGKPLENENLLENIKDQTDFGHIKNCDNKPCDDDKKLEESDEWEKDFEVSSDDKSLVSAAEVLREKYSIKENDESLKLETQTKEIAAKDKSTDKNDEWESWD